MTKLGKKTKCVGIVCAMLLCVATLADAWTMDNTVELTDDALITKKPADVYGIIVMTDGTNAVTVDMYDNTSASGTKLMPTWTVTTSATNRAASVSLPPARADTAVWVEITCAGTVKYMVYFRER